MCVINLSNKEQYNNGSLIIGFRYHQSRVCWSRTSKMLLSLLVRAFFLWVLTTHWMLIQFMFTLTSVGRPKHVRVMAGGLEGDVFIGRKAQEFRGLLKIKYPMEHGIVTDWDDMERIWSWVYAEELGTLSEEVRRSGSKCSTCAHRRVLSSTRCF